MPDPAVLRRLPSRCPKCGANPAIRVTVGLRTLVARELDEHPDAIAGGTSALSYQCHRRGCGAVYDITCGDIANAKL